MTVTTALAVGDTVSLHHAKSSYRKIGTVVRVGRTRCDIEVGIHEDRSVVTTRQLSDPDLRLAVSPTLAAQVQEIIAAPTSAAWCAEARAYAETKRALEAASVWTEVTPTHVTSPYGKIVCNPKGAWWVTLTGNFTASCWFLNLFDAKAWVLAQAS